MSKKIKFKVKIPVAAFTSKPCKQCGANAATDNQDNPSDSQELKQVVLPGYGVVAMPKAIGDYVELLILANNGSPINQRAEQN